MPYKSFAYYQSGKDLTGQISGLNHSFPNKDHLKNTPIFNGKVTQESNFSSWKGLWKSNNITRDGSHETKNMSLQERRALWEQLTNQPYSLKQLQDLFGAFSMPKESMSFYDRGTYNRLISSLIQSQRDGRTFTIVANGGSTTAGGGKPAVPQPHRFYSRFAGYLNTFLSSNQNKSQKPPTVRSIGQGHGSRNSFHTAIFFDNFIPPDVDLLLWEFSINDADWDFNVNNTIDSMLAWLSQVSKMNPVPPVILIYQWDSPIRRNESSNRIGCRTLDSHGTLARQFDFVVGHIDMAKYIDELGICQQPKGCHPLVSDEHHMNTVGHMAMAFVLFNFLNPNISLAPPSDIHENKTRNEGGHQFHWGCGLETKAKQILKDAMTVTNTSIQSIQWKGPLGAWTLERPFSDHVTPKRLEPSAVIFQNLHNVGKQDPIRQDRQLCTPLYDCGGNGTSSVSVATPLEPMKNARVVLLLFRRFELLETSNLQLRLNGSLQPTKGELVPVRVKAKQEIYNQWRCFLGQNWGATADVYVYIFEEKQPTVHSIDICTAKRYRKSHYPRIQSLAVW